MARFYLYTENPAIAAGFFFENIKTIHTPKTRCKGTKNLRNEQEKSRFCKVDFAKITNLHIKCDFLYINFAVSKKSITFAPSNKKKQLKNI